MGEIWAKSLSLFHNSFYLLYLHVTPFQSLCVITDDHTKSALLRVALPALFQPLSDPSGRPVPPSSHIRSLTHVEDSRKRTPRLRESAISYCALSTRCSRGILAGKRSASETFQRPCATRALHVFPAVSVAGKRRRPHTMFTRTHPTPKPPLRVVVPSGQHSAPVARTDALVCAGAVLLFTLTGSPPGALLSRFHPTPGDSPKALSQRLGHGMETH